MTQRLPIILFALLMAAIPFIPGMPPFWIVLLDNIGLAALVAMGLVLLTGVGGLTSFGQAAFCGFGAYTTAVLTTAYGVSPWLTLPLSLLVSGIAAVALGLVTVRLSGHYLPLGTIAWGLGLFYLFSKLEFLGRNDGISGIPPLSIGSLRMIDPGTIYFAIWIAVVICALLTTNLLDSRTGRAIRALRRGHIAAEAFGVQTPRAKLLVFIYAAVLAGLSGWLYAHFQRAANPTPFGAQAGIEYLFIAVVGGAGYVWGGVLGAAIVVILKEILQSYLPYLFHGEGQLETIVFGILLVVLLQLAPTGVWPWLMARLPFKPNRKRPDTSLTLPARTRTAAAPGVLLQIDNARKQFGGVIAVNDVSFDVQAREIVALIGPNGAGKSTTFNLITGVLTSSGGTISVLGRNIDNAPPQQVAKLGIARTFQHVKLVPDMSVLENVAIGAHLRGRAGAISSMFRLDRADEAKLLAEAARQIERVGLGGQIDQLAGEPVARSATYRRNRARAVRRPDPAAARRAGRRTAASGEETARGPAATAARRRHVGAAGGARHGICDGTRRPRRGARLRHQDCRRHAGRDQDQSRRDQGLSRSRFMNPGVSALLSVSDVHVAYGKVEAVRSVSLDVAENEIVTIIGANGAGKTTLLNAIMGILPLKGHVTFAGEDVVALEIEDRVAAGLSLVTEHRELFGTMSVEDNLQLGAFRIAKAVAAKSFERVYTLFPRLKERRKQLAGTLSGGEQQMLAMGRALMGAPRLLMLDEPSLGLAPIIVADIFRTIGELRSAGVSVLLVEQNAQAALQIADRAYVMELGEFILNGQAKDIATNERVAASYLGFQHG